MFNIKEYSKGDIINKEEDTTTEEDIMKDMMIMNLYIYQKWMD